MTQKPAPISLGYIDHWELEHGIKELTCQRQRHGGKRQGKSYSLPNTARTVITTWRRQQTDGQKSETKHLVMGVSEHRNSSSAIGQFGEGLKLAMVTVCGSRQQELRTVNHDGADCVSVEENPQMGNVKMPVVTIEPCEPQERVTFHIEGLTKQELANILDMMWESVSFTKVWKARTSQSIGHIPACCNAGGIAMGEKPATVAAVKHGSCIVNRDRKMPNSLEEADLASRQSAHLSYPTSKKGTSVLQNRKKNADTSLLMDIERRFNLLEDLPPLSFQIKADLDTGLIREEEAEFPSFSKRTKWGQLIWQPAAGRPKIRPTVAFQKRW